MAQTITVANIKLGMNVDEMRKNGEFARHELNSIARMLKDSETPLDKYAAKMQLLDKAYAAGGMSAATFAQAQDALAKKFGVMTYAMEEAAQAERKLADEAKRAADAQAELTKRAAELEKSRLAEIARKAAEAEAELAKEAANLARILQQSETPLQRMHREVQSLDRAFTQGKIDIHQYNQAIDAMAKKHGLEAIYADRAKAAEEGLARVVKVATATVKENTQAKQESNVATTTATSSLSRLAMGYLGFGAALAGLKKTIGIAAEMEQTQVAFEVMTDSGLKARQMMEDFKKLDVESPINFSDFARAGKTLLQFGVTADQVKPTLARLSAISLGNPEQFQSLALAFGQVQANGKLMGQEVLQMVNAGFNPLAEISRTTGIAMADLRKQMEDGKVSAQMVADAFKSATEEGGRFAGMNEKLAQTLSGQFAKAGGDVKALAIEIGTALTPAVTALLEAFRTQASGGGTKALTSTLGTFAQGWGFLVSYAQGKSNEYLLNLSELGRAEEDAIADAMHAEWMRLENKKKADAEAGKLAEQAKARAAEEAAAEKAKAAEIAKDELNKKQIEELKSLRDQYDQLTMTENEYMAAKQKAAGYSENDIKRYQTLNKLIEEAKQKKQAEQDAEKVKEGMRSPQEQLQAELQRIEGMVALGPDKGLSRQQGDQAAMEAAMRFGTQSGQEIAKNIAPTLKAGTKEAFTFMQAENAKGKQEAERKKMAEDLLKEAKKANELAENAPRIAFRR
jgi:tape measure domain-containing protein